jgi:hypothetical protein
MNSPSLLGNFCSLFFRVLSLFRLIKFPVPTFREIAPKLLMFLELSGSDLLESAKFFQFSL